MLNLERKNVEKNIEKAKSRNEKCRIDRKLCLMLIMKHLFDFNEKIKIRLLQMTNSQKKLFKKGGGVWINNRQRTCVSGHFSIDEFINKILNYVFKCLKRAIYIRSSNVTSIFLRDCPYATGLSILRSLDVFYMDLLWIMSHMNNAFVSLFSLSIRYSRTIVHTSLLEEKYQLIDETILKEDERKYEKNNMNKHWYRSITTS